MHRIYFEKRCIIICDPSEQALADPNSVEFHMGGQINIHTLVAMFEASESLSRIYIPTEDTGWMYRRVCAEFKEVDAAGGLVCNRRGDYLLINRNGLWDRPRGTGSTARTSRSRRSGKCARRPGSTSWSSAA